MKNNKNIILKKKRIKKSSESHGGAWKIAYADFVTAMMAFFLMLWLLSTVSDDQKRGIADYFAPNIVTMDFNQTGHALLGGESLSGKQSTRRDIKEDAPPAFQDKGSPSYAHHNEQQIDDKNKNNSINKLNHNQVAIVEPIVNEGVSVAVRDLTREEQERKDQAKLEKMEESPRDLSENQKFEQENLRKIESQISEILKQHDAWSSHVKMEITRDGLVLNIFDLDKKPLFTSGSATLLKRTQDIIKVICSAIVSIKNKLVISGHTDAYSYANEKLYGNWELSCDRANSTRRYMVSQGIDEGRFVRIDGVEAREPINPDNIYAPENRRIRIIITREYKLDLDQLKQLNSESVEAQALPAQVAS